MKEIVHEFLKSDLTESEFFGLSKNNLINLKEYLLLLKLKDDDFRNMTQRQLASMKKKCDWLKEISFHGLQSSSTGEYIKLSVGIRLYANDGNDLFAMFDEKTNSYVGSFKGNELPKIYLISKKVRNDIKRQDDFKLITDELHEVEEIGKMIYYGWLYLKRDSISDNFQIYNTPSLGISLLSGNALLANYFERNIKYYEKPYLVEDAKKRMLTKVQLKLY